MVLDWNEQKGGRFLQRDTFYLAGLLHDIGKFIERSKKYSYDQKFSHVVVGHAKHSAQLLEVLMKKNSFLCNFDHDIVELVLYHHQPRNEWEKLIQLADWLSSSEREEGDTKEIYYTVPLRPIFSRLFEGLEANYGYELAPLTISEGFPKVEAKVSVDCYKKQVDSFLKELSLVKSLSQLYYLLEKYLWCVPAQTTNYVPDISLFDHAKTTAAIALCLFDEYSEGRLTSEGLKKMKENTDNHFMLINGDVSGIQDFIFNIPSKGAAKTLKGHSVYINLLTDVITRYLVKEMDLKEANILYNGGGNFYILAPLKWKEKFLKLREKISELLLEVHGGALYVALDYIALSPNDFMAFNQQWEKVKQKVNQLKQRKWSEVGLRKHYKTIFGPLGVGVKEGEHCCFCGTEQGERKLVVDQENGKSCCTFCYSFRQLTDELKNADCLTIKEVSPARSAIQDYRDVFKSFGYEYCFSRREQIKREDRQFTFLINDTSFLTDGYKGYQFGAYQLPLNKDKSQQLNFEEISQKSAGDPKLALLKLDVDNLGNLFFQGLGERTTISRVTTLSRMLALFFEGYINHLIEANNWHNHIYVVFSGGDDTFIVGAWDKVLDFTQSFYHMFRKFTCHHSKVTFSAGIGIFRFDYPIIMSSQLTEEELENAKNYAENGDKLPTKNRVSLFNEIFTWTEFKKIEELKNDLLKIMANNCSNDETGRSFLYKIWKSTLGFKRILEDSLNGRVDNVRFWRLAYYLRNIARDDAERLINHYREIVINNLLDKSTNSKVKNIMVIPAAVKWAQMESRRIGG